MKGIVFTEFMEMVEKTWDMDMVDDLIDTVSPESEGAYTSVGTYDYEELVAFVSVLSERTGIAINELIYTFGVHMAGSFVAKFPEFFAQATTTFDVLRKVDNHIHVEVRKLYPDAELPSFSYQQEHPDELILHYESSRNLADLAHGLIDACAQHFKEDIAVSRTGSCEGDLHKETFVLTLR
jgi:hypothetical protein